MAARDMSPEAVQKRMNALYESSLSPEDYFAKCAKEPKNEWNPPEKKYSLKIKNPDRSIKEAQVKEQVEEYYKEQKLFYKRINTQGQFMMIGPGEARLATNSMKGMLDFYLCIEGISVWEEIKRPAGAYTESQRQYITNIIRCGGVAGIVTCVQDAERLIAEARILRKKQPTLACKERLLKIAFSPQDYTI